MAWRTHITDLPDNLLIKILFDRKQPPQRFESDELWESTFPKPKHVKTAEASLLPDEPPPDAAASFTIASVCRRWRRLAKAEVRALVVGGSQLVSLQDLSNAVTCFRNLSSLHLSNGPGSVETMNDEFLAHLAATCPQLKSLYMGGDLSTRAVTEAGLGVLFQQCSRLEVLSLLFLKDAVPLPASFFHLTSLHTYDLTDVSLLLAPHLTKLSSLTTLRIACNTITNEQIMGLVRLTTLTDLSLIEGARLANYDEDHAARAMHAISSLPRLKSLYFPLMFRSGSPCTSLESLCMMSRSWGAFFDATLQYELLPEGIADLLPHLRQLHYAPAAGANEQLPTDFTMLSCLERLTIDGSSLQSLPHDLGYMRALKSLSLERVGVSELPESIGQLESLKTLVLKGIPLSGLPDSLTQLASLETFFMMDCDCELPPGFCTLTALNTLCLNERNDHSLPEDIGGLTGLHTFYLKFASFQRLPSSFTNLTSLVRVELKSCEITELPEGIHALRRLRELHISSCPTLAHIPDSLTLLTSLQTLVVKGSGGCPTVPGNLGNLTRLKRLELRGCDLLPGSLPVSLEVLKVGCDAVALPPPDISRLPNLTRLKLVNVDVEHGKVESGSLRLRRLKLVLSSDAKQLPINLTNLAQLHSLTIQNAKTIQSFGSALPELRELKIEVFELWELPASISRLANLTSITILRAPNFTSLPHSLGSLTRLRELVVAFCPSLERFPDSLTQLCCLHTLFVTNTSIDSLPSNISQLKRLRILSVRHCPRLRAPPDDFSQFPMLRLLDIDPQQRRLSSFGGSIFVLGDDSG